MPDARTYTTAVHRALEDVEAALDDAWNKACAACDLAKTPDERAVTTDALDSVSRVYWFVNGACADLLAQL